MKPYQKQKFYLQDFVITMLAYLKNYEPMSNQYVKLILNQ